MCSAVSREHGYAIEVNIDWEKEKEKRGKLEVERQSDTTASFLEEEFVNGYIVRHLKGQSPIKKKRRRGTIKHM